MSKPIVRVGVTIDAEVWKILTEAESFRGARPVDFFVEGGAPQVWLCYAIDSNDAVRRFREEVVGDLPLKWAGEESEVQEAYRSYFRAAVEAAKAEMRLESIQDVGVGPGIQASRNGLETARLAFEAALDRDSRAHAKSEVARTAESPETGEADFPTSGDYEN